MGEGGGAVLGPDGGRVVVWVGGVVGGFVVVMLVGVGVLVVVVVRVRGECVVYCCYEEDEVGEEGCYAVEDYGAAGVGLVAGEGVYYMGWSLIGVCAFFLRRLWRLRIEVAQRDLRIGI